MTTCPTCGGSFPEAVYCPHDGARLVASQASLLGGRYRLLRKVGAGGMGEVFEGQHVYTMRRVAIKLLRRDIASDVEAISRLQREAASTSGLGHPNIVESLDFGHAEDGRTYLVMEWLEGEPLDALVSKGLLDFEVVLSIARQICAGLAEAHERGLIHRDLKLANLFVTRDRRGALSAKILDFGIAKHGLDSTRLTGTGVVIGTPNYMAPEQAMGDLIDARADLYSLGVILYELLVGEVPFRAERPLVVMHQHISMPPVPPSVAAPGRGIPASLEAIVMRCLAKRPEDRYSSAQELGDALAAVGGGGGERVAVPSTLPVPRPRPRRRIIGIVASLVGIAFLAAAGVLLAGRLHLDEQAHSPAPAADAGPTAASAAADASSADAAVDAPPSVSWVRDGHGTRVSYTATIPAPGAIAGKHFDLVIELRELDEALRAAVTRGDLTLHVSVLYADGHALDQQSTHLVDASARVEIPLGLPRAGRYHVRLELRRGRATIERFGFDVPVEASP